MGKQDHVRVELLRPRRPSLGGHLDEFRGRSVGHLDVINAFRDQRQDFDVSGRTIRFSAKAPLPPALVKRIVKARVRENVASVKA
jgi:hypothetical protein